MYMEHRKDDAARPRHAHIKTDPAAKSEAAPAVASIVGQTIPDADNAAALEPKPISDEAQIASDDAKHTADAAETTHTKGATQKKRPAQKKRSGQKKSAKRSNPWRIVFVIALIVFIVSIAVLALIGLSYCQGQQKYGDVAKESGLDTAGINEGSDIDSIKVDWDALKAANPETVAWVYMPNTPINYPVVQGPDNDKYLTIDFDGDAGWFANYGAIFLDYRNAPDFSDKANFMYGHHMNDGSMFAELAKLPDPSRFNECRTIYLLTPNGNYKLRTFALLHVDPSDPLVQNEFIDEADYRAYVQDKVDRAIVTVTDAPPIDKIDRVFALATCDDYGAGRYILYAYIVDKSAQGLEGSVGVLEEDGQAVGLDEQLAEEGAQQEENVDEQTEPSEDGAGEGNDEGASEDGEEGVGEGYDEGEEA